ncbi:SAM-dependent methyltransferase [Methylibium rhizosphaerae]|uniref:SAM-dependent methyltransferase n=1 Tax=Methylibium rhizosphaerae TaxID=2570323 RepID=UPI00112E30F1|nr:SAM-dependent methyltransferase [Methylibium rhizosphaerae]
MSAPLGSLLLVPNTLDFGTLDGDGQAPDLQEVLPLGVIRTAAGLKHWVAENAKTTRAFLKRVDAVVRLVRPLQELDIRELPRAHKGAHKATPGAQAADMRLLLAPALAGEDVGLISEAGLPAVADPGAALVEAAHAAGVEVQALPGPNSLLLALASSGLNGQSFAFAGYLPTLAGERTQRLKDMEQTSKRLNQAQIVIETPYRNNALLDALLAGLQPTTRLSVSCGLTLASGWTRSDTIARWRGHRGTLPDDTPAVFCFQAA